MIFFGALALLASEINLAVFNAYVVIFLELDLGTAIVLITVIVSLRNIFQLFLRVPLGELSQIIGRKPLIIFGDLSYTIALGLLFFATSWHYVLIATIILATGMAAFWPALFSFIGDVSQEKNNYGENTD